MRMTKASKYLHPALRNCEMNEKEVAQVSFFSCDRQKKLQITTEAIPLIT